MVMNSVVLGLRQEKTGFVRCGGKTGIGCLM